MRDSRYGELQSARGPHQGRERHCQPITLLSVHSNFYILADVPACELPCTPWKFNYRINENPYNKLRAYRSPTAPGQKLAHVYFKEEAGRQAADEG
jgi:hypothetical protein